MAQPQGRPGIAVIGSEMRRAVAVFPFSSFGFASVEVTVLATPQAANPR